MEMEIPKNTVIHCPTEELARKVLELLRAKGYIITFSRYIYDIYDQNTCFSCKYHENKGIGFSSLAFYLNEGLPIISAEEFLKQYNMEKKEIKVEVPEGMEVDLEKSIMNEHEVSIVYKAIKKYEDYINIRPSQSEFFLTVSRGDSSLTDNFGSAKQLEKIFAINQLQNIANYYNKGWEINWDNANQEKHCIYYVKQENKFKQTAYTTLNLAQVFFANKQDAQSVIDNPNFRNILDKIYK